MKTFLGSLTVLLSVVALAFGVYFLKYRVLATVAAPQEAHPTPVVFAKPQSTKLRSNTTLVGTVVAPRMLQLKTETVGTVESIYFQSGDIVKPGQVLVELDTSVEKAMLASARAAERIADSTYRRIKQAMEVQALSESDLDQTEAQLAQARAEVARIEAVIGRKVLVAPFEARAGVFDIQPRQYLSEGSLITMLQGIDEFVYVDFMMPQQVADYLQVGDQVALEHLGQNLQAQVIAVDSQADRVSRSLGARAKVMSPPSTLQVNDSVKVVAQFGEAQTTLLIPSSALRSNPTGAFCFVAQVDPTDTSKWIAKRREVLVGSTVGNDVSIRQGLEPNEQIIADGSFKIYDGTWVVPSELTKAAP